MDVGGRASGTLIRAITLAGAVAATACGGGAAHRPPATRTQEPSSTSTEATATPVVFPVAPAADDRPVWDFVRAWQGAYISPILRPAYVPQRLTSVSVFQPRMKIDQRLLSVQYTGPNKLLRIEAGGQNALEAYEGGPQHTVTVRGHAAVFEVNSGGDPRQGAVLSWREPGSWLPDGGAAFDHVDYALIETGLTEAQLLRVANSLTPAGP